MVSAVVMRRSEKSFGPGVANRREISSWSSRRMLIAKQRLRLEVLERGGPLVHGDQHERRIERQRRDRIGGQAVLARFAARRDHRHARRKVTHDFALLLGIECHEGNLVSSGAKRHSFRLSRFQVDRSRRKRYFSPVTKKQAAATTPKMRGANRGNMTIGKMARKVRAACT